MGSVGNQNPWAPYNNYGSADCSQGVCSIYCPQFCYFFFPPPPPESNDDSTPFSPLIIAVIGVLASAFLLVGYYTLVTRYCNRRRQQNHNINSNSTIINHSADHHTQCRAGLDESVIRAIAVRAYRKGDGLSECAVCLSEFREKEPIRVLPKCNHAFHPPCIDTWLLSQSTCPLCRAAVDIGYPYHHHEVVGQRAADLVLEVEDDDDHDDETILLGINDGHEDEEEGIVVIKGLGRSVSLRIDVEGKGQRWRGIIGTSEEEEEDCGGVRRMMMKRSVSTGGLSLTVDDGRGCLLPLPNS